MKNVPVLYLDFDGVLHPADVRVTPAEPRRSVVYVRGEATALPFFEHLALLENLLEPICSCTSCSPLAGYGSLGMDSRLSS